MQHIEGVPLGTKIKRVGNAHYGEPFISDTKRVIEWKTYSASFGVYVILEPDNVYNVLDLSAVVIPEAGYKYAEKDWFREPRDGETYITSYGCLALSNGCWPKPPFQQDTRRIILEPIKPKTSRVLMLEINEEDCHSSFPSDDELTHLGVGASFLYRNTKAARIRTRIEEREL